MFLKHGWPHAFRGEEFERARDQWQTEFSSLQNAVEDARPWGAECTMYFPEQDQALDRLSDFLAAGADEPAA